MGYFSWECKCCGESAKSGDDWMGQVVVVGSDGSTIKGKYDGYGRVLSRALGEVELMAEGDFALYHAQCYVLAGKPDYDGPSDPANDQGLGESEVEPQSLEDITSIKSRRKARDAARKAAWLKVKAEMVAEYKAKGEPVPDWLGGTDA